MTMMAEYVDHYHVLGIAYDGRRSCYRDRNPGETPHVDQAGGSV